MVLIVAQQVNEVAIEGRPSFRKRALE